MTDKSVGLIEGLILKPGNHGRRTYSKPAKRALVELCKKPGASVAALALAHGINANLLRRWMDRCSNETVGLPDLKKRREVALLPVAPLPSATREPTTAESCIEITLHPVMIRVRGAVDAHSLSSVLDCLAQRA